MPAGRSTGLSLERPGRASVRHTAWLTDVRRAYIDQAALGYLIYLLGAISAFLAATLALSDAQVGLHSSAMAVGLIGAGLVGHRLDVRSGASRPPGSARHPRAGHRLIARRPPSL
jgi:hypothetical protein